MYKFFFLLLALASNPALASATLDDALASFRQHDYNKALEAFTQLANQHQDDKKILYYLARSQYKAGKNKAAKETLERLVKIDPNDVEALYLQGIVDMALVPDSGIFGKLGLAKSALASWQQAVKADPNHVRSRYALFSYYANAPAIAGGDIDKAREEIKKIKSLDAPYADMATAVLYIKEKDLDRAEKYLKRAANNFSDGAFPYFALANYYVEQHRYKDALDALDEFRNAKKNWRDPEKAAQWFLEGKIRAGMKDIKQARVAYDKALAAHPTAALESRIKSQLDKL